MTEQYSPFFVFGPQKCGSSLLATLLAQHPDIAVAVDTVVLNNFFEWLINHKTRDIVFHPEQDEPAKYFDGNSLRDDVLLQNAGYDEVKWFLAVSFSRYFSTSVNRLRKLLDLQGEKADSEFLYAEEMLPYHHGLALDPQPVLERAKAGCRWSDVISEIIRQLAYPEGSSVTPFYGEKTPGHIRFAKFIAAAYPQARLILMVREPVANVASYYKRNNAGLYLGHKGNIGEALRIYESFMNPCFPFYQANRDRFLVVRYEDLIASPQAAMERVFRHLGAAPFMVGENFGSGAKGVYVGNGIDRKRAESAYSVLGDAETRMVETALADVYREFYPEKSLHAA